MINETIYEDGNGGQLYNKNNDIARSNGLATLAYLEMFTGNVEQSTTRENSLGELRFDWWGNDTKNNSSTWINSETERTLKGIDLSGRSIARITQAVKNDMARLQQYGEIEVNVTLPAINRCKISVSIREPGQKNSNTLIVIWDATKSEIIENVIL